MNRPKSKDRTRTGMHFGFLDESGGVDPFSGSHVFVVALLITNTPRSLELHVKRTRQKLGRRVNAAELKATSSNERIITRILQSIAEEDVEIVTTVVDKQTILRPPADPEDIYREAVTRCVMRSVERWPRLDLVLDKRYTNRALRRELEKIIREGIADLEQKVILIRQEDSRKHKGLQIVDFIAWAIFQKYEAGDDRFYAIIQDKIVIEEKVSHHLW